MFVQQLFRALLASIDGLIYTFCAELYDLVMLIASARVFQDDTITEFAGRIYQLLGLIMLFKLIFSFLTYVINPEDIANKDKGVPNLVKRIIISLCIIVITPWAFKESRALQSIIIEDGVIEYFVFGEIVPSETSPGYNFMHIVGEQFVKPYKCPEEGCKRKKSSKSDDLVSCSGDWTKDPKIREVGTKGLDENSASQGECLYGLTSESYEIEDIRYWVQRAVLPKSNGKYDLYALMNLGSAGYGNFADWIFDRADGFPFEYNYLISTLVGIAVGYMLIIMCIDVAVRTVKLGFYEIIAPIPIMSYIGFKSGKDSMLNKWFSQVLKTYADLFIRITGLQFAIFFISLMNDNKFDDQGNFLVRIFLYLGILTFAKELPKILEGMGIKFDGGGFNLKKKYSAASPLLGMASGALGGMAGNFMAAKASGKGFVRSAWSALGGAVTGTARGGWAGAKDKDGFGISKGFNAAGKGGQKFVKRQGTSFWGRKAAGIQQRLGLDTQADKNKQRFENEDEALTAIDTLKKHIEQEALKDTTLKNTNDVDFTDSEGDTRKVKTGTNIAKLRSIYEILKTGGTMSDDSRTYLDTQGITKDTATYSPAQLLVTIESALAKAKDQAVRKYGDDHLTTDPKYKTELEHVKQVYSKLQKTPKYSGTNFTNFSDLVYRVDPLTGKRNDINSTIQTNSSDRYSPETKTAQKNKDYSAPKGGGK